jgi:O-antigen chain-terminating methyltransferase
MSNSFYRAFEDRHRGSRELIKSRLAVYHPFLAPLPAVAHPALALDLGCGRGEWLELLGELGFSARGVDLDEGMLAACRERGLDVATADALSSLRALPDATLALVSAFHLVEHIPFDDVQELIAQALRVLRPGGLLIMETPNPENLVVGSTNFYTDPSHLRPVPPLLLDFAVEFAGFARHKVVRLQEPEALRGAASVELINVLNGVSPDYSVVGQKAADAPVLGAFDAAFAAPFGLELDELARRYDQRSQAREADAAAALAKLEERVVAAEQGPAQLFQRTLDTIDQAHAATRAAQTELLACREAQAELLASQERERALAHSHAEAAAQLARELQQLRSAQADVEGSGQQTRQQLDAMTAQLQHAQAERDAMAARLEHAQSERDAATGRARAAEETVAALYASTSWRIAAPLRAVRRIGGVRPRTAPAGGSGTSFARRVLQWGMRKVLQHRRLTEFALGVLARHPGLKARLRRAAAPTAFTQAAPSHTSSATTMTNPNQPQLPARAARLLSDLQKASAERKH